MGEHLTLVNEGVATFCVQVVPPQDAEGLLTAITDLSTHLRACLDRPVTWFDRWPDRPNNMPAVRLVLRYEPLGNLGREAFEINATPDALTCGRQPLSACNMPCRTFWSRLLACDGFGRARRAP